MIGKYEHTYLGPGITSGSAFSEPFGIISITYRNVPYP
jgi:hypothetical protein